MSQKNVFNEDFIQRVFLFLFLFFFPISLSSTSLHQTLPSWHWAYQFIDELRLRGCFEELDAMNRPYTRSEVAEALVRIENRLKKKELSLSSSDLKLLEKLIEEFQEEINELESKTPENDKVRLGARLRSDVDKPKDDKAKYKGIYRSKISVPLGTHVEVYNGINFNQYLIDDTTYVGKKWRGIVGYTEQAYAAVGIGRFRFKFGRDFLRWGAGESGTLLFSDIARPMDQFTASAQLGPFRYTFLASALDDITLDSKIADSLGGSSAKRYISAHRLDVNLMHGRLQCAVTEAVLYGGIDRQLDWVFLNPFIFYHGAQLNKSGSDNTFGTVDVSFFPVKKWEFYGSLLIDDIQLEKTGPGDLEPNEIGWLFGSRLGDPFGVSGLTLSGEYVRVTNRTYKTPNSWETFIHRNKPLGYPLGDDFDYWQMGVSKWFGGDIWLKLGYSQTRKGEGSLFTPWDAPWFAYTVEQGYSEPFPTGVVEKRREVRFSLRYYPSIHWGIEGEIHPVWRENAYHVEGRSKKETNWRVGIWFDGDFKFRM